MKKKLIALITVGMLLMTVGCGSTANSGTTAESKNAGTSETADVSSGDEATNESEGSGDVGKVVIAQAMPTLDNPWYVTFAEGSADMAEALGVDFSQVTNPGTSEWDSDSQISVIQNLIATKPDVIEVDPVSTDGINSVIDEARERGIAVVVSGSKVSATADCYVVANNYQGGQLCGEELAEMLGEKGKIAVLDATPGRDVMDARVDGFKSIIEQYDGIEIVAEQIANSSREEAVTQMESILQANPDIDAVWAANDEMALGAVEALRAAGMEKDVIVGGFDASSDGVSSIAAGEMNFSADQLPYEIGCRAIAISYMIAKGMDIPSDDIELEMGMVDQDNVVSYQENEAENHLATLNSVLEEYGLTDMAK